VRPGYSLGAANVMCVFAHNPRADTSGVSRDRKPVSIDRITLAPARRDA
jgi:hypothetical protein